jgi:hypothetical protein
MPGVVYYYELQMKIKLAGANDKPASQLGVELPLDSSYYFIVLIEGYT